MSALAGLKQNLDIVANTVPIAVALIIDNSGSMEDYIQDVVAGFNDFINDQASKKGSMLLSVAKFDGGYNPIFNGLQLSGLNKAKAAEASKEKTTNVVSKRFKATSDVTAARPSEPNKVMCLSSYSHGSQYDINEVKHAQECFEKAYTVGGSTSIRDAIKRAIEDLEQELKSGKRDPKEKIIVGILTDGEDNTSRTTSEEIKTLIEKKKKEGWNFFFLGTKDAKPEQLAPQLGFSKNQAAAYADVKDGINFLSNKISEGRKDLTGKTLGITQSERLALASPGGINKQQKDL